MTYCRQDGSPDPIARRGGLAALRQPHRRGQLVVLQNIGEPAREVTAACVVGDDIAVDDSQLAREVVDIARFADDRAVGSTKAESMVGGQQ